MLHFVLELWFSNDFRALGSELVVFQLPNLVEMDEQSINHIIDCGLHKVVKLEALRTKNILVE